MKRVAGPLHFVGIGGIGMAALAELFHARGYEVSGSDLVASATFERLRSLGVEATIGHHEDHVARAATVVRSSAIAENNPEILAARSRGLTILGRGELLALVLQEKDAIAIAGSHGKTTTSAMTAHLFEIAGLDPTALIGGRVPRANGGASPVRVGRGGMILAEVDESDGSFLRTRPLYAAITNIDPEHLDHYGSRETLLTAFVEFAGALPSSGACIVGTDHPGVREILPRLSCRTISFGFDTRADVRAEAVTPIHGGQRVSVRYAGSEGFDFELPMPGRHNVLNALAAIAIALELDIAPPIIQEAMKSFPGVSRRYERKGAVAGIEVVDDYAHHPAEVKAILAAARSIHEGPIAAIFQPHRYTRTRDCWDEFTTAFDDADRVVICDIYPASESPIEGIDGAALAKAIGERGHAGAHYGGALDLIEHEWPKRFEEGELVLTLGAGDVVSLGPKLLDALASDRRSSS